MIEIHCIVFLNFDVHMLYASSIFIRSLLLYNERDHIDNLDSPYLGSDIVYIIHIDVMRLGGPNCNGLERTAST